MAGVTLPVLVNASSENTFVENKNTIQKTQQQPLEATWILQILSEAKENLVLLTDLDQALDNPKASPELRKQISQHKILELQYVDFVNNWQSNQLAHNEKNAELYRELDAVVTDSVRSLGRSLREISVHAVRNSDNEFINAMSKMIQLMRYKLNQTTEEERYQREQLVELAAIEEEDKARLMELQERAQTEREEHNRHLRGQDDKIARLRAQIKQVEEQTQEERLAFRKMMAQESAEAEKAYENDKINLLQQLELAEAQLGTDGQENFRQEMAYHRRKNLRADELTTLINQYDEDLTFKQESLVDLQHVYEKEKKELQELSTYFENVNMERKRIELEHKRIHAARNQELEDNRKLGAAEEMARMLFQPYEAMYGPKPLKVLKKKSITNKKK